MIAPMDSPPSLAPSPIMRALRYPAEEVQFAKVLAALARQPGVAHHLASGLLACLAGERVEALQRTLPRDVYCVDEQWVTARLGRSVLRKRSDQRGRVDLDFRAPGGWRLIFELKINSPLTQTQIEKYTPTAPVAAVVRSASHAPEPNPAKGWLGAVEWRRLASTLHTLPVGDSVAQQWRELLRVVEDDGDFNEAPPVETVEAGLAFRLLQPVRDSFLTTVIRELEQRHGRRAQGLVDTLGVSEIILYRGRWSGFDLESSDGEQRPEQLLGVRLRDASSDMPTLQLSWHPPRYRTPREARLNVNTAITHAEVEYDFVRTVNYNSYRTTRPVSQDRIAATVDDIVGGLIRVGALDLDVSDF